MKSLGLLKLRKTGFAMIRFILLTLLWMTYSTPVFAVGSIIASAILAQGTAAWIVSTVAFAINLVASSIISKAFAPDVPNNPRAEPAIGNRQQIPPAGNNKLPVVYGRAFVGGIITDMTITNNNQNIYWVIALSEVTNTENGGSGDAITFGKVYWGGKLCRFDDPDKPYRVTALFDESTGDSQDVEGYLDIYLYSNGSYTPTNSTLNAIDVLSIPELTYKWDATKLMTNCAFAIIRLRYSQSRNTTQLNQTKFEVINSRTATGDCLLDYLTSIRYGAAIPLASIDTASIDALNAYSNQSIVYTPYGGGTSYQKRFTFNGTVDTAENIMPNLQQMADCCDCLLRYSEITGLWGVVVQTPYAFPVMNINDTNMVSAITISPIDIANSFNIVEVKFPDSSANDAFNSVTYDLAVINPSLLFPNEPVNKQSVSLSLVNNSVQAQYIANRFLEAAREDLQMTVEINYIGLQLEAGDIVTVTNANYGWTDKLFRISKVVQKFGDDGQVTAALTLMEYNPQVYDDINITEFTPSPNSGIGSPITFGSIPAPYISNSLPNAANPAFSVYVTTSSSGITQYAEIWYSAYKFPTETQRIFAGTTEINSNGNPYDINTLMPPVQLFNIPAGNWYFFSRMVNSIASSDFSPASEIYKWRPTTFQYTERYLSVAYADDENGNGFSLSPRNKIYYGLYNQSTQTPSLTPSDYKWYIAEPNFGDNIYLVYINRTGRRFSFDTDFAIYAAGTAAFVPSTATQFDPSIWSALEDGINYIDLDVRTGQLIETGTTTVGTGEIAIVNNNDGKIVASLQQFLDFGGAPTLTGSAATITIDIYGRVLGFTTPDNFYFSEQNFVATAGQTVFTPTARAAGYIAGQDLILQNGCLLDPSEYTETTTTFTLAVGANAGDQISCISMRAVSIAAYYENLHINVLSTGTNTVTWDSANMPYQYINVGDILTFANTGTPTQYTVTAVNYTTQTITFSTNPTATAGAVIYRYRAAGSSYPVFSRYTTTMTSAGSYTPTDWALHSGYELVFLNGTAVNEQDYDISGNTITNFPATVTGNLTIIQFGENNLTTPIGTPSNTVVYTTTGQATYSATFAANAFNLYANGVFLIDTSDYTLGSGSYTFSITPTNSTTVLLQQTFASAGAA